MASKTLNLWMNCYGSPQRQTICFKRGEDVTLRFVGSPPRDITNWAVEFLIKDARTGTTQVDLTPAVDNGPRCIVTCAVAEAATESDTLTNALADGKGYDWELARTDSGESLTLAFGSFILEAEVNT